MAGEGISELGDLSGESLKIENKENKDWKNNHIQRLQDRRRREQQNKNI